MSLNSILRDCVFGLRKNWRQQVKEILLIFLFGGMFQMVVWCQTCFETVDKFILNMCFSGCFWVFLWKGSEVSVFVWEAIYPWLEYPVKRFIAGVISVAVLAGSVVVGLHFFFDLVLLGKSWESAISEIFEVPVVETIFVTLGINTLMHGRAFLMQWRQASIDMEKLKTEQVSTQYESLKNQVNPHFLFNSLNALTSLVYDDQEKAVDFIRKLSNVYRYVLEKKDEELVPLDDELGFMENYIFLQKIRFGENLVTRLENSNSGGMLPPLALQILVENAIKHNVISEKDPLTIEVDVDDEFCTVKNTVKEKLTKDSTGIGLSNLVARYGYLSEKEVQVNPSTGHFEVKLPILYLKDQ